VQLHAQFDQPIVWRRGRDRNRRRYGRRRLRMDGDQQRRVDHGHVRLERHGDGTVGYSVQNLPSTAPRTGTLTIAGQTFTVTQSL